MWEYIEGGVALPLLPPPWCCGPRKPEKALSRVFIPEFFLRASELSGRPFYGNEHHGGSSSASTIMVLGITVELFGQKRI